MLYKQLARCACQEPFDGAFAEIILVTCFVWWLSFAMQIMSNSGTALLGIGRGAGPDRAEEAIYDAINTPLLQGHAIQVCLAFSVVQPASQCT